MQKSFLNACVKKSQSNDDSIEPPSTSLSWKDIKVRVKTLVNRLRCCQNKKVEEKQILHGVSGIVKEGSLLAIMGASGAGKTTLLNVLTGRNVSGLEVSGHIYANGFEIGRGIKYISAYVQQDDLFLSTLTVREQLQFRALLHMDRELNKNQRLQRVEEVIQEMGLGKCANSSIGNPFGSKRGISGGERKRLSFASEALTNPPIFFCDEPTSGLDSSMAQNVVKMLQWMASKGHIILCTIHQPSSDLFSMFNRILIMSEGKTAFNGTTNEALEFFSSLGYPCPHNYNPADHYVLTLAIKQGTPEAMQHSLIVCKAFSVSSKAKVIQLEVDNEVMLAKKRMNDPLLAEVDSVESRYNASLAKQLRYLFWRSWITQFRDVMLFRVRSIQSVIVAMVFGLIYLQLETNQKGVMNINGAIFILIVSVSFSNVLAVINSFPQELPIFLREYGNGLYNTHVYFFAKTISEAPLFLATSVVFVTVAYWMIGFYSSMYAFLWAQIVYFLVALVALSMGYFVSAMAGSVTVALAIAPPMITPFMLFGGLFINISQIPFYFKWLKYLSWFNYANEILMVKQWENIDSISCQNGTDTANVTSESSDPQRCLFRTGNDVLAYSSFDKDDVVFDLQMLCALVVFLRVLAYIALLVKAKQSRE